MLQVNKVTIASVQIGKQTRTGLGFLYDETTVVCSYSDVKGASQIQVQWGGRSTNANRLISFNESMDLAILAAQEEIPVVTPIASSSTLAAGDRISYWREREGNWELSKGSVHEILDSGKGYNLILIESNNYSTRSTPLYNEEGKIVGWLQGKRAIPMETIAFFADKQAGSISINDLAANPSWKFTKPSSGSSQSGLSFDEPKTVSGPATFPFKVNLPGDWEPKVSGGPVKFHVRYERSGICVEIRAIPLGEDDDLLTALSQMESFIFPDFLRAELIPYSAENLTGFRAHYEDSDPMNPYELQTFCTSFSGNLYLLSISYPKKIEEEMKPLVERIFSSFRM